MQVEERRRYIDPETKYQNGDLLIVGRNSRASGRNQYMETTKK